MRKTIWNLRHRLAWWIAPGVHKHLSTYVSHDECPRPLCQSAARLNRHSADSIDSVVHDALA